MKAEFRVLTELKAINFKAGLLFFKVKCKDLTSYSEGRMMKSKPIKGRSGSSSIQLQTNINLTQVEKSKIMSR